MTQTTAHDTLRAHLAHRASFGDTAAQHVLDHGRDYKIIRNDNLPFGKAKLCYTNATHAAIWDDEYTYVEGWCMGIIPFQHAWIEDSDGNAIDVTLRFGSDTCGFCDGTTRVELEDHTDCDLCDGDGQDWGCEADLPCNWCNETGKVDTNADWDPDRAYIGVAVNDDLLTEVIRKAGTYGVLDKPLYYRKAQEATCH